MKRVSWNFVTSISDRKWKKAIFLLLISVTLFPALTKAQQEEEYDEINVFVTIQQVGGVEMGAVLKGNTVYLPVADLFQFLKIKTDISAGMDSVTGFFLTPDMSYIIDYPDRRIIVKDKAYDLREDGMIKTETNIYVNTKYLDPLFGLSCSFSFRSLSVNIIPAVELPVVRELRLQNMRKNVTRLRGEEVADTVIGRCYPLFSFGMAEYSIISNQELNGPCDNRINVKLGGILFGGETEIGINYSTSEPFTEEDQHYLWRYANNDHKALRQVLAGKINSQAVSSIYSPVVGAQLTNTPTTYRKSFGSYTLSDFTKPGWIVELYVNNVLVDYVRADASGFFTFQVPLVYGSSDVKLKFYGPWGEEQVRKQNFTIPYTFLPKKELEYTVSGGFVEDSSMSRFSRGNLNYGLTRWMTIGGGVEYLSSVTSGPVMPFVNTSFRIGSSMLVSADYTYGVRFKGEATYRMPSSLQFDALYIRYAKGQTAITYNISEERKFVVSMPFSGRKISTYARLTFDQIILPETSSATTELLLSGSFFGINTNFTTYLMMAEKANPYLYSNLALGFRFPYGFLLTPQAQYDYTNSQFISGKIELEKHLLKHGYVNVSFERNQRSDINNFQIGMRYDFSGLQTAFTFRQTNNISTFIESAKGNIIFDAKTNRTIFTNRSVTGRGGLVIIPFLDINSNGTRDDGEPKLSGLNIRINGGWVQEEVEDTVLRVFDLEPYTYYILNADQNSIRNIAWRLKASTYKVFIDANQMKLVEIPVQVLGEASGYVYLKTPRGQKGQGRIIVNFYNEEGNKITSVLTEPDGFFSTLKFSPGRYYASIDSSQMQKVGLKASPDKLNFEIERIIDGDVADDLEFTLTSANIRKSDTAEIIKPEVATDGADDEKRIVEPIIKKTGPVERKNVNESVIRIGVFKNQSNADKAKKYLETFFPGSVTVRIEGPYSKVEITVPTGKIAPALEILKKTPYRDAYLLKNNQ